MKPSLYMQTFSILKEKYLSKQKVKFHKGKHLKTHG